MKRVFTLLFLLISATFAFAQTTQTGYAKTKGRMDSKGNLIPGTRIGGVSIQLTGGHSTVADANGDFTLTAPDKKFYLSDVQKQGYVLTDPDILKKQYVCSSNPLVISMETKEKLADDQLAAERKLRRQLQKQLQQKEDEIDALKEENRITEEEYRQALQKLYEDQESNEKLVSEMAKRYAEIDYDLLDEFYRQVSFCIENGDLVKADSLLRSRGDVSQQIKDAQKKAQALNEEKEKLRQAEAVLAADIDELARRCYGFYENFASQFLNDSAAYYLELRANLDTTNLEWQWEAGRFIRDYLGDYNKAVGYCQRALQQAISQRGENHSDVATSYNEMAVVCSRLSEYDRAMEYHQKALTIRQALYGENHPDVATCYDNIGNVHYHLGEYEQALKYQQQALAVRQAAFGENHPDIAVSYGHIGGTYWGMGDYAQALEYLQKSLAINLSAYGENSIEVASKYNNLGSVYSDINQTELALENYQKALSIMLVLCGEEHPDVATLYSNIGSVYDDLGDYPNAMEYQQKSLSIKKNLYGENHPEVAISYNNIGAVYYSQGKDSLALEYRQKALKAMRLVYGDIHPYVAICYNNVGISYYYLGDYAHSLENNQKALEIRQTLFGEKHPYVAISYNNLAGVYDKQGDDAKALEYYQKALDILKAIYKENIPLTLRIEKNIASLKREMMAQDPVAMNQYVYTVTFEASENQELSGEYMVLKFENWTIDDTKSLYEVRNEMKGKPTTILLMKDNVITQHTFEKGIDVPIDLKKVGKKEKARILGLYHQYK